MNFEYHPFRHDKLVCLFVLGFYGPVNNEVMSSRSVNSDTVPRQALNRLPI